MPIVGAAIFGNAMRSPSSRRGCVLARYQLSAAVSAPGREILEVPLGVAVFAHPLASELPVVALEELLGDTLELEEQHVPRLLALLDRRSPDRVRLPDRQDNEPVDAVGRKAGGDPREPGAPVVADDVRPLDPELVEDGEDVPE